MKQAEEDYRRPGRKTESGRRIGFGQTDREASPGTRAIAYRTGTLGASGNIKDLRGRLQDGQPCPVCGSTHHPFANQVPVAPVSALTLQLQDLSNKKETYVAHTRHLTRLQQQLLQLHKELADSEAACKEMAGKQQLAASRQEREEAIVKEQSTC